MEGICIQNIWRPKKKPEAEEIVMEEEVRDLPIQEVVKAKKNEKQKGIRYWWN